MDTQKILDVLKEKKYQQLSFVTGITLKHKKIYC